MNALRHQLPRANAAILLATLCLAQSSDAQSTVANSQGASPVAKQDLAAQVEDALSLWKGEDGSHLKLTAKLESAYFNQSDSWFGNSQGNLGAKSTDWWETAFHPGIEGSLSGVAEGELYGRLSAVSATTGSNLDAAGSNPGGSESSTRLEEAYLGWRSGDFFSYGKDLLDVSFGRQQYMAGTGFLFYSESANGKQRGADWIGERNAAAYAGVIHLNADKLKADLVYFKADDSPDTDTSVGGITVDYADSAWGSLGGGYYQLSSDLDTRDSMEVYDLRGQYLPFKAWEGPEWLHALSFEGEYVYEDNGNTLEADAWTASVGYSWEDAPFKPSVTYRYASFEGDDPNTNTSEAFDPLFYGASDWGQWFQGEIMGEYVLSNSNLNSHAFILKAAPSESVKLHLIYYIFELDNEQSYGVSDEALATETDLIVDWTVTQNLSFSFVLAAADPDEGAKEAYGGNDTWLYGMIYGTLSF